MPGSPPLPDAGAGLHAAAGVMAGLTGNAGGALAATMNLPAHVAGAIGHAIKAAITAPVKLAGAVGGALGGSAPFVHGLGFHMPGLDAAASAQIQAQMKALQDQLGGLSGGANPPGMPPPPPPPTAGGYPKPPSMPDVPPPPPGYAPSKRSPSSTDLSDNIFLKWILINKKKCTDAGGTCYTPSFLPTFPQTCPDGKTKMFPCCLTGSHSICCM